MAYNLNFNKYNNPFVKKINMENNKENRNSTSKKSTIVNNKDTTVQKKRLSGKFEPDNKLLTKEFERTELSQKTLNNKEMPKGIKQKPLNDRTKRGYAEEQFGSRGDDKERTKNDSKRKGLENRESEIKGGKENGDTKKLKGKSVHEQELRNKKNVAHSNDEDNGINLYETDNSQQFESEYPRKKYGSVQRKNIK